MALARSVVRLRVPINRLSQGVRTLGCGPRLDRRGGQKRQQVVDLLTPARNLQMTLEVYSTLALEPGNLALRPGLKSDKLRVLEHGLP